MNNFKVIGIYKEEQICMPLEEIHVAIDLKEQIYLPDVKYFINCIKN